jgi:hypothetical protein
MRNTEDMAAAMQYFWVSNRGNCPIDSVPVYKDVYHSLLVGVDKAHGGCCHLPPISIKLTKSDARMPKRVGTMSTKHESVDTMIGRLRNRLERLGPGPQWKTLKVEVEIPS